MNGLKCQDRRKFCWCWRKFSNSHCDQILLQIFFVLISINTKVPLICLIKIQPKLTSHSWRNGLKCPGQSKFCWGQRKFSNGHCDLITLQIFFNQHQGPTNTPYKFQPNKSSRSGENGEFISFAIFSNSRHLEFSTRLNFYYSEVLESDRAQ